VYGIDVIWPGMLGEYFVDLKPYFADQVCAQFPAIVTSYTVNNRLLAMPRTAGIGLLYYRTDLLRPYGYRAPQNLGRTGDDGGPDSSGRTSQSKKQSGDLCGKVPLLKP